MTSVNLNLSGARLHALSARGWKLHGVAVAGKLEKTSRIEGPTAILCTVAPGAFLDIGAFCNLSGGAINNLRAGRYCSIATGVVIGAHEHPTDWLTTSRIPYYPQVNDWDTLMAGEAAPSLHSRKRPFRDSCPITTLGPDVWIGQGAFVKSGVTIGAGAIVGARATVLKDVPPYAVVVGTPARVVRLRFSEPIVERLLASAWWRYSLYDLFDAPFDDIERALDEIEAQVAAGTVAPFQGSVMTVDDLADPLALPGGPAIRAAS